MGIVGLIALLFFKMKGLFSGGIVAPDTTNKITVKGKRTKEDGQLRAIADQIEAEVSSSFNTDEDLIVSLIKGLSPPDLTQLYNLFGKRYNNLLHGLNQVDLIQFLRDSLSQDQFNGLSQNLHNAGLI